jgi:glycosyltransferase involved in cell wall biosynthesis
MQLSVVIGTYNRAHLLAGTLGALAAQQAPASLEWEIVVVDNNSTDSTAQAVAAFSPTTGTPVRYAFERRQGISNARNRGIREAQGSILAFTDDDVLPAPDWVSGVAAAMERWDAHGVGGRILPRWESERPRWLIENRRPLRLLALMEHAESAWLALPLKPHPQVWGANMAFRRELFDRVGEFDPRRGVMGERLLRGEESDLIERALDLGLKIAYDPTLTVFHRIGPDRMRKAYFRRLEFESARGEARLHSAGPGPTFLGAPLQGYRDAAADLGRWAGLAWSGRRNFDRELRWWASLGSLSGHW